MTTPLETKKCPEDLSTQNAKAKYCSECGYSFYNSEENKTDSLRVFSKLISSVFAKWKPILITSGIVLAIWFFMLPAPYSLKYLLKCVFYTPTAVCEDRVYSFSASRSGTCSNHGGVTKWY